MTASGITPPVSVLSVTVRAPAKVNLHLGVGPVRADGYHPLATVYQAIGLYDDLTATEATEWSVEVAAAGPVDVGAVPLDDANLAVRAGRLLVAHHGRDDAVRIRIGKGIPVAGGLAGGSADAAAALVAVDRLLDLHTTDEDLLRLAAELGSDVPFALLGGTAYGTGRGELVEPLTDRGDWWWVVLPNRAGLSTPAVYREFDNDDTGSTETPFALFAALADGDPTELGAHLRNDLQTAATTLRSDLTPTLAALGTTSALGVLLSGSGPTCLALAADADHARAIAGELNADGLEPVLCAPAPVAGAHVVEY